MSSRLQSRWSVSLWRPTWQQVYNVSWSTRYYVRLIKTRRVQRKTRDCDNQLNCHWLLKILYCHDGDPNLNTYYGPVHDPLSLYTKLENTSNTRLDFYFLRYGLWMNFMIMTLDVCVKRPKWSLQWRHHIVKDRRTLSIFIISLLQSLSTCHISFKTAGEMDRLQAAIMLKIKHTWFNWIKPCFFCKRFRAVRSCCGWV